MGGYLRWLNAAPEPDDEVFIILLSSLCTIYPLRFWMQITMFWRHLIDFGTGWLQTAPAKRRVLDQVILRSNTKMKSRSNSPGWGKVRKSRSWRRCWRWRRWPSRIDGTCHLNCEFHFLNFIAVVAKLDLWASSCFWFHWTVYLLRIVLGSPSNIGSLSQFVAQHDW